MAGELKVRVERLGADPEAVTAAARSALEHSGPAADNSSSGGVRLLSLEQPDDGDAGELSGRVRATGYDYVGDRALLLDVPLDGGGVPEVSSSSRQPAPSGEEREAARAIVEQDPVLGPAIRAGRLVAYRAMPPLVGSELPDGTIERVVSVGLRPADGSSEKHEIVGVHFGRSEVVRFESGSPGRAVASARLCGLPDAQQETTTVRAGAAQITVTRDGETLWRLIAVRPAASSGSDGSGVELRSVSYRGKRVLRRAHVPILNVRYDDDACGPFRDWQNEESRFQAQGSAPAPGFRLCPAPATTILESGEDRGNFAGVAVFVDGDEVELVSELEAGWYRYISRWRLHANGTIRPRFGFGAVTNSCVCTTHHHHAYWRLDFDIGGSADDAVLEHNDPPLPGQTGNWHTLRHEIRRRRNPDRARSWRIRNRGSGEGYVLTPGAQDGEADSYGVGDFWALRHRPNQIDDRTVATDTRAHLDSFVNGDSIVGTNVVVWYAAHFTHDVTHEHDNGNHVVGPTLRPDRW